MVDGLESGTAISAYLVVQDWNHKVRRYGCERQCGSACKFQYPRCRCDKYICLAKENSSITTAEDGQNCHGVVKKELGGHANRH